MYVSKAFGGGRGGSFKSGKGTKSELAAATLPSLAPKVGGNATLALHSRGSPTKGTNENGPKRGRECYITPAFSGVPKKGNNSKRAQKRAEMLRHPCCLGDPQQRGQNQSTK